MEAIEAIGLVKTYGERRAVDGVSFTAREGEIFSLLGPNGAGKTTTISMLCGLLRPDEGEARLMGHSILHEPEAAKGMLGVVPQEIALYEDLSAWENLIFWGKMYGLRGAALQRRAAEMLEVIGLSERAKERVGKFSGGMKRRVNIAVALLHKPKVIFMDEPTAGIDPQSRRNILDSVVGLKNQGMTVLYTTHYMEEAQEISDRIAIMDHGKLIASGTHEELVRIVGKMDRITLSLGGLPSGEVLQRALEAWQQIAGVSQVTREDEQVSLLVEESNLALPPLFETANALGVRIRAVELQEPNLEAVFLHLTGRALRD